MTSHTEYSRNRLRQLGLMYKGRNILLRALFTFRSRVTLVGVVTLLSLCGLISNAQAAPSPGATCVVTAQNRTAPMNADGSYVLSNLPGNGLIPFGTNASAQPFRVRAVCDDGTLGETPMAFPNFEDKVVLSGDIIWGQNTPKPSELKLTYPGNLLRSGQTLSPTVFGFYEDGSTQDLTLRATGTGYRSSNSLFVSVTANGDAYLRNFIGGEFPPAVVLTAENDGVVSSRVLSPTLNIQLTGTVYRPGGTAPVAGAKVRLHSYAMEATTDINGKYLFDNVPSSNIELTAYEPFTRSYSHTLAHVYPNNLLVKNLELVGVGSAVVTVVDANDIPLQGIDVAIADSAANVASDTVPLAPKQILKTDAQGMVTLQGVAAGSVSPVLAIKGYASTPATATLQADGTVSFTVKVTGSPVGGVASLTGAITESGTGLPGVGVVIMLTETTGLLRSFSYLTGANGKYIFEGLQPSTTYQVKLLRNDIVIAQSTVTTGGAGASTVGNFTFARASIISGVVRNSDGVTVAPNRMVMLSQSSASTWWFVKSVVTNAQGKYVFSPVIPGLYRIDAIDQNGKVSSAEVTVASVGSNVVLDINLPAAQNVMTYARLDVRDAVSNLSLSNTQIYVTNSRCVTPCLIGTTGDGVSVLTDALPLGANMFEARRGGRVGQVTVNVDALTDGLTVQKTIMLAAAANETLGTLDFPAQRSLYSFPAVAGDIVNLSVLGYAVNGTPAAYASKIEIFDPTKLLIATGYGFGPPYSNTYGAIKALTLDTTGTYTAVVSPYYEHLPQYLGGYWLDLSVNGEVNQLQRYVGGGGVQGTVYGLDGITPLPNATVDIITRDTLGLHERKTTDVGGHYQFDNLPLADLTVSLIEAGQALVSAADKLDTPAQVIVKDLKVPHKTTLQVSITVPVGTSIPYQMSFIVTDANGTRNVGPVLFSGNYTSASFTTVAIGDTISISAIHPSNAYINTTQIVNGADGQTIAVNLVLDSAKVGGTILKADGTPSPGTWVRALRANDLSYITSTYTDSQGGYLLTALPVGQDLLISAQNSGNYLDSSLIVNVGSGQQLFGQDITLMPTGSVTGLVKYSSGEVIPNANIMVTGIMNGSSFSLSGVTDQNGQYLIDSLPVGATIQVSATAPGLGGSQQQSVLIDTANQLLTLPDFTFVHGTTLQVNVLDGNHQPRPDIFFSMWGECRSNYLLVTTSRGDTIIDANNPAGFAPLQDMPVGPAVVKFYGDDCGSARLLASASINIEPNRSYTVDLVVPLVIAKVTLEGGFPAHYASVSLTQVNPDGSTAYLSPVGGNSAQNNSGLNTFIFAGVQPGDFSIFATDYYYGSNVYATMNATMAGNTNVSIDIILPYTYAGPGAIVGSVKYSDGTPAPNMSVMLFQSQTGYTTYVTTDAFGLYMFYWPVAGAFDITAQDPNTGWSASASGNMVAAVANRVDLVMPPAGTVTGTLYDSNYNPIPYADVYVNSSGLPGVDLYTTTDAQGVYRIERVALGIITVMNSQVGFGTGTLNADRQTLTLNLNDVAGGYTGPGMISGIVTFSDGAPVGGAGVSLNQNGQGLYTTTDGSGYYQFASPTIGAFDVLVQDRTSGLSKTASGIVMASVINTTDIVMPSSGIVNGIVYDSSNTPLPNTAITVSSSGVPGFTRSVTTDAQGQYRIDHVALGDIVVTEPSRLLSGLGFLNTDQQNITVDLHVMYTGQGMISGKVRFHDGTPVINADVALTQNGQTEWGISDNVGGYQFLLPIIGAYEITAYDIDSALSATASGILTAGVINTIDLIMPSAGSVTGTLYDLNNQPLLDADVYANSTGMPGIDFYGLTDAQGVYRINQVPVGTITVSGYDIVTNMVASSTGTLRNNLEVITVDLHEAAGGIVAGRVLADAAGTPVPFATVTLLTNRSYGPFWPLQQSVAADASGAFNFGSAPLGGFRLYAVDPANPGLVGFSDGTVVANAAVNVDVTLGNATGLPFALTGSDGSVYNLACDGSLNNASPPYFWSYQLMIGNSYFPCLPGASLSFDKRELGFGPAMMETVQVTRKVYSPAAGGFVRFIDTYTNTGNADVAVRIQLGGITNYYAPLLVDPATNNQTYAVLDNPAVATVFGGAGGVQNPAGTFRYEAYSWTDALGVQNYYNASATYNWMLTVPAGKSISLMFYSAQAASGLVAQAIADALSTNTAPTMFDGIMPVDKTSIYNFVVP